MLVLDWMIEAPLLQKDVVGCARGRGLDAPGCRGGCDMEGPSESRRRWDARSATSVTTSASLWASSSLGRAHDGVMMASESMCGTVGSEGGGGRKTV